MSQQCPIYVRYEGTKLVVRNLRACRTGRYLDGLMTSGFYAFFTVDLSPVRGNATPAPACPEISADRGTPRLFAGSYDIILAQYLRTQPLPASVQ